METEGNRSPNTLRCEIIRLVRAVRRAGEADGYGGKRNCTRFTDELQLEVTTDPDKPDAAWAVFLHNVSEGGVAFWSKRELPHMASIYLREFSDDSSRTWLPARVTHRTVGIRGHLIGAEFEMPANARSATSRSVGATQVLPASGWERPRHR